MTDFSDKLRRRFKLVEPPPALEPSAPATVPEPLLDDDSPLQRRMAPSAAAEFLRRRLLRRQGEAAPQAPTDVAGLAEPGRLAAREELRQARFGADELSPSRRAPLRETGISRVPLGRVHGKVALPDGEELVNGRGRCFLRRLRYPLSHRHGSAELARVRTCASARLAKLARDDSLTGLDLRHCLFLDTETTGLSGGAGTVVFMCGVAFVEGDDLCLEQVFLRAFEDEPAALAHIAGHLLTRPRLVTFVGKSFDRHRLAARMAVHKIDNDIVATPHLDLYHVARRAWRLELPDTRLRTVEQVKLGLHRDDDLPGAEAPAAWLSWICDGTGPIDRVFEHNRLDVLSLVALLGELGSGPSPSPLV